MDWLTDIFIEHSFTQAILVMSLICAVGLAFGNIKIAGVSLGVTFVFFAGIIAGHFGITINPDMLALAQNFGLVMFIYSLGVQVGPGFLSAFRKGGIKLNVWALVLLLAGCVLTIVLHYASGIPLPEMMGLFSGAVTNTPMLGAAQQALLQVHPDNIESANNMATACAVGYPFGLIGVILCIAILKRFTPPSSQAKTVASRSDNTFVAEYRITNPDIFGKSIQEIRRGAEIQFVISRVWKDGKVIIPTSETILEEGEHIMVISSRNDTESLKAIFGSQENVDWNKKGIDWNSIDSQLMSRKILVTKPEMNGVKLGSLKLRNSFGINITRVNRAGIDLLPSRSLRLQLGDRLTIVGEERAIENVSRILGNQAKDLRNPNLVTMFIGIVLGLILGSIPFLLPGVSIPVKLGIAGGPIIVGILMGAFGPRFHLATYTTQSANLMLRQLGITIYLGGLGLSAGPGFFKTVFTTEGLIWVGISLALAIIPVLLTGVLAARFAKLDFARNMGMICAGMANPIALNYANSVAESDEPAVAYATVYPVSIFLRVISAQIIMLIFI